MSLVRGGVNRREGKSSSLSLAVSLMLKEHALELDDKWQAMLQEQINTKNAAQCAEQQLSGCTVHTYELH